MREERFKINVSTKGVITERNDAYAIKIPNGKFGGFMFWINKDNTKIISKANKYDSDVEEEMLELTIEKSEIFKLVKREEKRLVTAEELNDELDETYAKDYQRAKTNVYITLPKSATHEIKEDGYVFKTPVFCDIQNYCVEIPDQYIDISRDGNFSLSLPQGEMFTFRAIEGDGASVDLTPYQIFKRMDSTIDSDYDYSKTTMVYEKGDFYYIVLPSSARDLKGANATLIHMPKGSKYEGKNYFIPNNWIKEWGVSFIVSIPNSYSITLKDKDQDYDPRAKSLVHISPLQLIEELRAKQVQDY